MRCILCGSEKIRTIDTVISDFVMARITDGFVPDQGMNTPVRLCHCEDCTFGFYDYRFSDEETSRLYADYRGKQYQQTRERYECFYTAKVNDALNRDTIALEEQKRVITKMIGEPVDRELEVALDHGGNEGRTFTDQIGTKEKYVYDISGVKTVEGVTCLTDEAALGERHYDFIMCNMVFEHLSDPVETLRELRALGSPDTYYYIEVPSEDPFTSQNKFGILKNLSLLFSPYYSPIRLVRYYFRRRKLPFMPMHEHINFFTPRSIRRMAEQNGFQVIAVEENEERGVLGPGMVLSMLFRLA